ncbi:hypothetical protein CHS0354_024997 [Potamilus streckersoni]|uniref:C1q domain-containing protein n=1 Tax=Potamilus streckersoni TaxID=2493646 RepID=A0AAE0RU46_9BIVA|nr:hypothetical protein CHS0354_024997 [Potamilus streckersoni]
MEIFRALLAFILSSLVYSAEPPGIDYKQINDFDQRLLYEQNSLENTIDHAKSILELMERKLEQLQAYEKQMLIQQLKNKLMAPEETSKKSCIRMKILEDRLIKLENDHIVQFELISRKFNSLENRLSHVDELERKLHKAESRLSRLDRLEEKLKALEKYIVETSQKSSGANMEENLSPSELINIDNGTTDNKSSIHARNNEISKGYLEHVADDKLRGLRAPNEDRVAFRASGASRLDGHHTSERIIFASLDYSEGGGFDMSSGIFVCPITGTYFFTGTIGSINSVYIDAALKIDGELKMRLYAGFHLQGDNMSTGVTISHCRAGQSVWMEITNGVNLGGWEAISGFLLWSDSV